MDILKKIDEMRKKRGWSYYMLAQEAGLTQSTVLNMFSRGTQPSIKTLTAICFAFGITLSEFFAEDGDIMGADKGLSGNEKELIEMYRNLSEKELSEKLVDLKAELFHLRFQHAINQLENPKRIKAVKKDIARISTIIKENAMKNAQ